MLALPHVTVSGMQRPCAAAQCVPLGHTTPVLPQTWTWGSAQALIAQTIAPQNRRANSRVVDAM
jgi:hypothetical protein